MQVYLICENVDLGYHVVIGYLDNDQAKRACKAMNDDFRAKKINDLMQHCNYTFEAASDYARSDQYFIEDTELRLNTSLKQAQRWPSFSRVTMIMS